MNQFEEKSVLSDLPAQLRKDIFDNLYRDALKDAPIFGGCSAQFMTEVSLRMSPISFPQFQKVYCQGELGNKMFFITKGSVALILREIIGQPSQEDFLNLADSCVELCAGSFFGEASVLGHPSRLETIITTRSSTMMTLSLEDMADLCRLSFEFKAKIAIIALERMRRNRVSLEIVEYCAREFGLDPEELIFGVETAKEFEEEGENAVYARSISTRYNGATTRVVFNKNWKTLVVDRVCNSMVATIPKIFSSLGHVQENVEHIFNRLRELEGTNDSPSGVSPRRSGSARAVGRSTSGSFRHSSAGEAGKPGLPGAASSPESAIEKRLSSLEDKLDALIALTRERGASKEVDRREIDSIAIE
jgi:CRP-like cAMP-binding protein